MPQTENIGVSENDIRQILNQVKKNTRTDCISIKTEISNKRLSTTCSKFGGLPYWPKSKTRPYPHTMGELNLPLTMLAQINLSDLPENDVFPNRGILQFFILNGLDIDNFEVVFHTETEEPIVFTRSGPIVPFSLMQQEITITQESGKKKTIPNIYWGDEGFPIIGELALNFSKTCDFVNPTEYCFEQEFMMASKQLNIVLPDEFDVFKNLGEEYYNEFYNYSGGHKLLGRPCFVQDDYRYENYHNEDVLLFQIDSAWSTGKEDRYHFINLGDAGTANFFIKPEDLKKLDFSNVYYDWQCC